MTAVLSGTLSSIDVESYKAIWLLAAGPHFTDPAWLFGWTCLAVAFGEGGRPTTEIKQEPAVRRGKKPEHLKLRIQPFLRLPMFGVNGGCAFFFSQ
jgi:hypothetical protein